MLVADPFRRMLTKYLSELCQPLPFKYFKKSFSGEWWVAQCVILGEHCADHSRGRFFKE